MQPHWSPLYSLIKTAVLNLDSVELLLAQVVEEVALLFQADCLLWVGFEAERADALRVYASAQAADRLTELGLIAQPEARLTGTAAYRLRSLPDWLLDQQQLPQILQLKTGELMIPVTHRGSFSDLNTALPEAGQPLQFVLQLVRSPLRSTDPDDTDAPDSSWSEAELGSLEVIASQLGLAYSALYWRQRLDQFRQYGALVRRATRLLNSSLNANEMIEQTLAELGRELAVDRSLLIDLRDDPAHVIALWEQPPQPALTDRQIAADVWQSVIELFAQSGASYLQVGQGSSEFDPLSAWLQAASIASLLLVPVFTQSEFFGVVALASQQHERYYLLDELQTIRQVADLIALPLTQVQSRQNTAHQKQRRGLAPTQDELTQVMNRRSLDRELEQLSTAATWTVQPPFSILLGDLDYFKTVNDEYGSEIGDRVLQEVAHRLQGQLRKGTPTYRYGGEEFAIILTNTRLDQAVEVAERLRRTVRSAPIQTEAGGLEITLSFGVAQLEISQDRSAWDVLQRADQTLHNAKRLGRDRVEPHS